MTTSRNSFDRPSSVCVLLLTDDTSLRDWVLGPTLEQFGFDVVKAERVIEMYEVFKKRLPDIVLLDISLPDSNGFAVARKLRAEQIDVGIVMVSRPLKRADLVRGLREGADACLPKSVDGEVLVATLYSVARRLRSAAPTAVATWSLSSDGWLLLSPAGAGVKLNEMERQFLGILMKQPYEIVWRESIIATLVDGVIEFKPHQFDSIIQRLRRKVILSLGEPLPLDVVRGTGYVLAI